MRVPERMSDTSFKLMSLTFSVIDVLFPYIDKRVKSFDLQPGMTVVDYGCGPGRYTERFVKLVGETGQVYYVFYHPAADRVFGGAWRIAKPDGVLIIDDGHQPRQATKQKLAVSGLWRIEQETGDHLRCRPIQ